MSDRQPTDGEASDRVPSTGRRRFMQGSLAVLAASALSAGVVAEDGEEDAPPQAGPDDWQALMADLPDNWGRWGEDDELGAINGLGSEEMFAGMNAATRHGPESVERFTLQVPMTGVINEDGVTEEDEEPGDPAAEGRIPAVRDNIYPRGPEEITDGLNGSDDRLITDLYLQGTTHLDALGHVWVGDEIYNGFDASTTYAEKTFEGDYVPEGEDEETEEESYTTYGLERADITNAAEAGVVGRGVLLDVARHVNGDEEPLELGYGIGVDDLQATAESQGVELEHRDIVLVRTGGLKRYYEPDYEWNVNAEPGLRFQPELVEWVHEMEFPVLGADNIAVEQLVQTLESPTDDEEKQFLVPLHPAFLGRLGVSLHEIVWLEDLAAACAEDGVYEFLFAGAPLNVERGTGAPMNSMAVKATGEHEDC